MTASWWNCPTDRTGRSTGSEPGALSVAALTDVTSPAAAREAAAADSDTELIVERVLDGAERDGIILLHERYAGTIPAVPEIITELRARGYTFVTVSQLMAPAVPEPGAVYRP